jgi:hypothetical protein
LPADLAFGRDVVPLAFECGQGAQIGDLQVLGQRQRYLVDVGQLVDIRVDAPEVGIALEAIRERGFALSDREVGSNTRALAVPVRARNGAPIAAVGIVVDPANTSLEELVERHARRILSMDERISLALRYRG